MAGRGRSHHGMGTYRSGNAAAHTFLKFRSALQDARPSDAGAGRFMARRNVRALMLNVAATLWQDCPAAIIASASATSTDDNLRGLPSRTPRSFAACSPAFVRSRINSRSNSASAARMSFPNLPVDAIRSIPPTRFPLHVQSPPAAKASRRTIH